MNKSLRNWIAAAVAVIMIFLLVAIVLLQGRRAAGGPSEAKTPVMVATPVPQDKQIAELQQQLSNESLSEEGRRSLEEKLQMAERMATEETGSGEVRSTKIAPTIPAPVLPAMVETQPPFEEVLVDGSEGLIRPSLADINNLWQGSRNGQDLQVFAGRFSEMMGGGGVVIVIDLLPDKPTGDLNTYPAPEGSGALRIQKVQGLQVELMTESGQPLIFDLESRTYK